MNIGIIGTSEIAFRRFLPALTKCGGVTYGGVASRTAEKTARFTEAFGGKGYAGYDAMINDVSVDAVYIPLPPALHFEWAEKALERGKHVFLEKPSTVSPGQTERLVSLAGEKGLALKENYMFLHHPQLKTILSLLERNAIGKLRLIRAAFGFPRRDAGDFRYSRELGGGALLDCGGYTVRLASFLLGPDAAVTDSALDYENGVDIFGIAVLRNGRGLTAQVSFGMDCAYKCELELWGSAGYIKAPRIFTAPDGFGPEIVLETAEGKETVNAEAADQFLLSLEEFVDAVRNGGLRKRLYNDLSVQMGLVGRVK